MCQYPSALKKELNAEAEFLSETFLTGHLCHGYVLK